jgi:hypothetical protein
LATVADTDSAAIVAVLDGNVLDYLATAPDALAVVHAAQRDGRLRLLRTHLLGDELDGMQATEAAKLARLREVEVSLIFDDVPTAGFVLDASRLDHASLSDDTAEYEALTKGNARHAEDALLALTAQYTGSVLVTDDKPMTGRARARAIHVMSSAALVRALSSG